MTQSEAAKYLGLPVAQLKSWALQRAVGFHLAGPQYGGNHEKPMYDKAELDQWKAKAARRFKFTGHTER